MSSLITNRASPDASGDPELGIVQDLQGALTGLGIFPGPDGQVPPNDPAPHRMVVSERDWDRDARHPRPASLPEPRLRLSRSARLSQEPRTRADGICTGISASSWRRDACGCPRRSRPAAGWSSRSFKRSWHRDMCPSRSPHTASAVDTSSSGSTCTMSPSPRSTTMSSPGSFRTTAPVCIPTSSSGPAASRAATTADRRSDCSSST